MQNNEFRMKRRGGFTVPELLVAMTLFLIVIGAVSAIFIQALRAQRITAALMTINNNVSLAIEQLAREIRTGFDFCPGTACSPSQLVFTNSSNNSVVYLLENGVLKRSVNGGNAEPLTADDVTINQLTFLVTGEAAGDTLQPRITVALAVESTASILQNADIVTYLQTTISPRNPDS